MVFGKQADKNVKLSDRQTTLRHISNAMSNNLDYLGKVNSSKQLQGDAQQALREFIETGTVLFACVEQMKQKLSIDNSYSKLKLYLASGTILSQANSWLEDVQAIRNDESDC